VNENYDNLEKNHWEAGSFEILGQTIIIIVYLIKAVNEIIQIAFR
jgi:hypothetical protein